MSSSVFKKWTNAVLYLNNKIKSNKLIAGRNIQLENTGNGIRIHGSEENNSAGDAYNGYFKVIKTAPDKIKIIDGFDSESDYAGDVLINDTIFANIPVIELTITADSFIYLTSNGNTPFIYAYTAKQSYELGKSKILIGRVKFSDGKITKTSQEVYGIATGFIDGDCV